MVYIKKNFKKNLKNQSAEGFHHTLFPSNLVSFPRINHCYVFLMTPGNNVWLRRDSGARPPWFMFFVILGKLSY